MDWPALFSSCLCWRMNVCRNVIRGGVYRATLSWRWLGARCRMACFCKRISSVYTKETWFSGWAGERCRGITCEQSVYVRVCGRLMTAPLKLIRVWSHALTEDQVTNSSDRSRWEFLCGDHWDTMSCPLVRSPGCHLFAGLTRSVTCHRIPSVCHRALPSPFYILLLFHCL